MKRTFASHKKPQALSGLAVDTRERANVQRFYPDPYAALSALNNQMAWTDDWDTCQPGRVRWPLPATRATRHRYGSPRFTFGAALPFD